jgi:hypothetical protein
MSETGTTVIVSTHADENQRALRHVARFAHDHNPDCVDCTRALEVARCQHDSMDGIAAGEGLWWCWGCERPVVTWKNESTGMSSSRLATYDDIDRIVIEGHAALVGEVSELEGQVETLADALENT